MIHAADLNTSPSNVSTGNLLWKSTMATDPEDRYLARLHQMVTGLLRATTCRNPDMPATGTNAELTNTTGKIQVNDAACTASTCFSARPMQAEIHENAKPTAITSR